MSNYNYNFNEAKGEISKFLTSFSNLLQNNQTLVTDANASIDNLDESTNSSFQSYKKARTDLENYFNKMNMEYENKLASTNGAQTEIVKYLNMKKGNDNYDDISAKYNKLLSSADATQQRNDDVKFMKWVFTSQMLIGILGIIFYIYIFIAHWNQMNGVAGIMAFASNVKDKTNKIYTEIKSNQQKNAV